MDQTSSSLVVVFPIGTSAFGPRAAWLQTTLIGPSILLMTLFLVILVGVLTLRQFENANMTKKLWNIPVLLTIVVFWPALVVGLKELVDIFNTFLVVNVFKIPWRGFGFPEMDSISSIVLWPTAGLARLLPNLAYWIIYAFYLVFFFFYAVLGPLVLAKGVLMDEIENFFELVKELVTLLLWQTTMVILVAFIMPSIVSGEPFPSSPQQNFFFLSLILGILILFVPTLTRKFAVHIESSFVPFGFKWIGAAVGTAGLAKLGGSTASALGVSGKVAEKFQTMRHGVMKIEEVETRYHASKTIRDLKMEEHDKKKQEKEEKKFAKDRLIELSKKAKDEVGNEKK